jgi:hypothetical protein
MNPIGACHSFRYLEAKYASTQAYTCSIAVNDVRATQKVSEICVSMGQVYRVDVYVHNADTSTLSHRVVDSPE